MSDFRPGCTGKKRYGSGHEARSSAKHHRKLFGRRSKAYSCVFCDGWHLSVSARGVSRAEIERNNLRYADYLAKKGPQ